MQLFALTIALSDLVNVILQFTKYIDCYFCGDNNAVLTRQKDVEFMGNLCAFQFWQRVFKVK